MSVSLRERLLPTKRRLPSSQRRLTRALAIVWLSTLLFLEISIFAFTRLTEIQAWHGRQGEAAGNAARTVAASIQSADDALGLVGRLVRDDPAAAPRWMD